MLEKSQSNSPAPGMRILGTDNRCKVLMGRKDWAREEERDALALSPKKGSDGVVSGYQWREMIAMGPGTSSER